MSQARWGHAGAALRTCARLSSGRRAAGAGAMLTLTAMLVALAVPAAAATLSVVEQTVTWSGNSTEVVVELALSDAVGVAGIDFTLTYPAERFNDLPTSQDGALGFLIVPNTTQPDSVKVGCARATGIAQSGGTLLTLTFEAPCSGNAQAHPEGNPVAFTLSDLHFYDEHGDDLPATAQSGDVVLQCTGTPADGTSFSVLKAIYGLDRTLQ